MKMSKYVCVCVCLYIIQCQRNVTMKNKRNIETRICLFEHEDSEMISSLMDDPHVQLKSRAESFELHQLLRMHTSKFPRIIK